MKSRPISLLNGDSYLNTVAIAAVWSYVAQPATGKEVNLVIIGISSTGEEDIGSFELTPPATQYWYSNDDNDIISYTIKSPVNTAAGGWTLENPNRNHLKDSHASLFVINTNTELMGIRWKVEPEDGSNFNGISAIKVIANVNNIDQLLTGNSLSVMTVGIDSHI